MKLSIILLNYKRKELTLACVDSICQQFKKELENDIFEIIIADNHSQDDSITFLKAKVKEKGYKNIHLIINTENLGFGKGCNSGASYAKGDYLLFLNNDTVVLDRGLLGMVDLLEKNPKIGIVGGRMWNEDQTPQASAGKFYTLWNALLMLVGMQRFGMVYSSPVTQKKVDWVSGSSLMIRRDVFEKVDGFDKDIFMYVEDVELCFRVKKAGFLTYYYPNTKIMHMQHGSTNKTFAIVNIYKGLPHFYRKYMPKWQLNVLQLMLTVKALILIGIGRLTGNKYLIQTYEQALANIR